MNTFQDNVTVMTTQEAMQISWYY